MEGCRDGVVTHHRLLGTTYLPLGTTAHKQGCVAGENAIGGNARFAGSLGTQVAKIFDLVAARTGLRDHEATAAGSASVSTTSTPDDHMAYYPGATPLGSPWDAVQMATQSWERQVQAMRTPVR